MKRTRRVIAGSTVIPLMVTLLAPGGGAQNQAPQGGSARPAFKPEEIEQIVAPIALYPDPLIAQIFMASTYPVEIVQAARFAKGNEGLKGEQLDAELKKQTWDDSVKALVSFPQVLIMMSDKLDWTQKLGDAFLAQQKDVMDAVQRLRGKAQAAGNLKSTEQQTVKIEPAASAAAAPPAGAPPAPPPPGAAQTTVITIQPTNPEVIYVPTYSPTVVLVLVISHAVAFAAEGPKRFETLDDAVQALVKALRSDDRKALVDMFGSQGRPLVSSGDDVADRNAFQRFLAEYDEAHRLVAGDGKVVLQVGKEEFPFPIPLVPDGPSWRWDADAGREEILRRRIGRNELSTIQVCLAYVDAQREYYAGAHKSDGILEYAQRIASSPGKRDGLYWPVKPAEPPSPLGPLVAEARAQGYARGSGSARGQVPFHGYSYRVLLRQGSDAPGGAYEYVVGGHMIGGFGLIAYPARYGVSGVMTFIVNHDGVVYQKDLGQATARVAAEIQSFNPDSTWQRVDQVATTR